ncbi:MAG: response regulator [Desulfobacterales bacterium]|nr:response regulator [Desulfobacterales bacterium]
MSPKILIVDDEPNIVVPLQFLMEQNGYNVAVASTGDEAISAVQQHKPDLILLDIMLPGFDGFAICQKVRANPDCRDTKIIFITAMGRDMDIAKGMALGGDEFITKPFSNSEVVTKVKKLLSEK